MAGWIVDETWYHLTDETDGGELMAIDVIRLICPNLKCRSVLSVPGHARGKTVRCRQCGTRIRIPTQDQVKRPPVSSHVGDSTKGGQSGDGASHE